MSSQCHLKMAGLLITMQILSLTQASAIFLYDRFCIRNVGCETEFQDIVFGVRAIKNLGKKSFIVHDLRCLIFKVSNGRECQGWCDSNADCNYFTWFSDGMFGNVCFHHKECTQIDFICKDCYAGPRSSNYPQAPR